jgi:branched-subunit amino acid aminotransferase/4-amino-4-deoxychorismate lyase
LKSASLEGLSVSERAIPVSALDTASEIFVTNAIQQACNLRRIEGRELPGGNVFERMNGAFLRYLTQRSG